MFVQTELDTEWKCDMCACLCVSVGFSSVYVPNNMNALVIFEAAGISLEFRQVK